MPRDFDPIDTATTQPNLDTWPALPPEIPGCQYMAGDAAAGDVAKCGLPVTDGAAYCTVHRRRCVRPPMPFEALLRLAGLAEPES